MSLFSVVLLSLSSSFGILNLVEARDMKGTVKVCDIGRGLIEV